MNGVDINELLAAIDDFISGANQSRVHANKIEGIILEHFMGEQWFDDVSIALAQFSPGGGTNYYDEKALAIELKAVSDILRAQLKAK